MVVGDKKYYLNGGKVEWGIVVSIFDSEPFDGAAYEVQCCYLNKFGHENQKVFTHVDELFDEGDVERKEASYKSRYDEWVDPKNFYH